MSGAGEPDRPDASVSARERPPRHLFHVFSSFAVGGAQIRFVRLVNHYGAAYRHTVLAMDGVYDCRDRVAPSVALELLALTVDKTQPIANLWRFRRALAAIRPDLLVTYNWGATEWALANRFCPIAAHLHVEDGFGTDEAQRQHRRRVLFRRLALGGRQTRVVVPSFTLQRIADEVWRLPQNKVSLIVNGVDCERFATAAPVSLGDAGAGPVVGTVTALRPEKNLGRLLRAFAAANAEIPSRLAIVGDGPERARIEALARELKIAERVLFPGTVAAPEGWLQAMDVYAISSDTEQLPISLLEAMAAGRPVAGVDVGDVRAAVSEPNRPFIVAPGDEAGLARALVALLSQSRLRQEIGAANQARARQDYAERMMFDAWARLLD